MPGFAFRHLSHCCKDLEKTSRFYQEVLGFQLRNARDSQGDNVGKLLKMEPPFRVNLHFLTLDGLVLELQDFEYHDLVPGKEFIMNRPGLGFISVAAGDLDEVIRKTPLYGGRVLQETNIGGALLIEDPDGQPIEMVQMANAWAGSGDRPQPHGG